MKYFVVLVLALFLSCSSSDSNSSNPPDFIEIGNGVYYFHSVEQHFAESLAKFSLTHEIVTICGDGNGPYGRDKGYFVVCKGKKY
jgi:hypothetical protein